METICSETFQKYQEIFEEAYKLGLSSGSQGIFICPKIAFENYIEQRLETCFDLSGKMGVLNQSMEANGENPKPTLHQ